MLDVHPPHEPAHGWRDIVIHLATITVGLFIALTLEGCVEWQHHRHLVREARENIRTEVEDNQKELRNAIEQIHREQQELKEDAEALAKLRTDLHAKGLNMSLRLSNSSLQNASWSTARETGALGYMGYPEVKRYAEVYDLQSMFTAESTRVLSVYTDSFHVFSLFDMDKNAPDNVKHADVDDALRRVLAVQGELLIYDALAEELNRSYDKLLSTRF